jgi:hypothetical protein
MDMQEPEEQRLESEPIEPAEDIVETSSDEPVLNDSAASESDEEPASVTQLASEAADESVEEEAGEEPALVVVSGEEVEAGLGEKPDTDVSMGDEIGLVFSHEDAKSGSELGGD